MLIKTVSALTRTVLTHMLMMRVCKCILKTSTTEERSQRDKWFSSRSNFAIKTVSLITVLTLTFLKEKKNSS